MIFSLKSNAIFSFEIQNIYRHILYVGGPYSAFAGCDASRGLATFNVTSSGDQYDDLSDLSTMEMESVREWESQFKGRSSYSI